MGYLEIDAHYLKMLIDHLEVTHGSDRNYSRLVADATRVMLRIKAIFRARAIRMPGRSVYGASRRDLWLED
jgi:hypothetical protein